MAIVIRNKEILQDVINRLEKLNFDGSQPVYACELKEHKLNRTLAQNGLYWLWVGEIKDHIYLSTGERHSKDDLHDYLSSEFLPTRVIEVMGKIKAIRSSTAKLNTKTFTNYLEQIDMYAVNNLELNLSRPQDLYFKAMGIE